MRGIGGLRVRAKLWLALGAAALAFGAVPASADQRNFTYTYDWFTPARGEKEIEATWTQSNGGNIQPEIEFEYGVTNRWVVAPYLLLSREHDGDLHVQGWRLEQRYRLGEFSYHRFLPALYFEINKENGEPFELEGKFITSYLFGNGYIWSTNLIFAGLVNSHQGTEFSYATGISHPIHGKLRGGVEFFGELTPERSHFFGPSLAYRFNPTAQLLVTAGLKYSGSEGSAIRFLFEKEWH